MAARRVAAHATVAALLAITVAHGDVEAAHAAAPASTRSAVDGGTHRALCAAPAPGTAACQGAVLTDPTGAVVTTAAPAGLGPSDIAGAYHLPSATRGSSMTVAIVVADDDPNAEADQSVYRSTYGLPACASSSGCFRRVDQGGGSNYPPPNVGWAGETSLDLDMVAATCPLCHVLLVEATNASSINLALAVDTAAALGATEISNSYARTEWSAETNLDSHYNHPGIMITVATGNAGFTGSATYPAASPYVTAVGGTVLTPSSNTRGWTEAAWSRTTSGCSVYEPKPAWQHDPGCARRTIADTAAVATGVAVYDTYTNTGGGWMVDEGTSAPTPIIAAVYALAGNGAKLTYGSSTYRTGISLYDIKTGSTGTCGTYLCSAGRGYDGPTGNGTPHGISGY